MGQEERWKDIFWSCATNSHKGSGRKKTDAAVNHIYKFSCQCVFEIIGVQVPSLRRLAVRHTYQSGIDQTLIYFLIN